MKIRIRFLEEMLGTACADPEVHKEFIAKKSADKDKIKEELESLSSDELLEKAVTVIPRNAEGKPILWDYQVRGFFKEWLGAMVEFAPLEIKKGKKTFKFSKWTYKRLVDNFVFVSPRQIEMKMPCEGNIGVCTRPLRGETLKGPRVALATSETVPAGTECEFEIKTLVPELQPFIEDCLNNGALKGLGQWRNSGKGSFEWENLS